MRLRHRGQDVFIDLLGEDLLQGCGVDHRTGVKNDCKEGSFVIDVLRADRRIELAQGVVVVRTKKGEWCDEGAGANASHQLKRRAGAGRGPAIQQASAEGTVGTAPGKGKHVDG